MLSRLKEKFIIKKKEPKKPYKILTMDIKMPNALNSIRILDRMMQRYEIEDFALGNEDDETVLRLRIKVTSSKEAYKIVKEISRFYSIGYFETDYC